MLYRAVRFDPNGWGKDKKKKYLPRLWEVFKMENLTIFSFPNLKSKSL